MGTQCALVERNEAPLDASVRIENGSALGRDGGKQICAELDEPILISDRDE